MQKVRRGLRAPRPLGRKAEMPRLRRSAARKTNLDVQRLGGGFVEAARRLRFGRRLLRRISLGRTLLPFGRLLLRRARVVCKAARLSQGEGCAAVALRFALRCFRESRFFFRHVRASTRTFPQPARRLLPPQIGRDGRTLGRSRSAGCSTSSRFKTTSLPTRTPTLSTAARLPKPPCAQRRCA